MGISPRCLQMGSIPNQRDKYDWTPLLLACRVSVV